MALFVIQRTNQIVIVENKFFFSLKKLNMVALETKKYRKSKRPEQEEIDSFKSQRTGTPSKHCPHETLRLNIIHTVIITIYIYIYMYIYSIN